MTAHLTLGEYRQLSLFKSARQRGVRPADAPEFRTQCALADLLRQWASPEWFWTAFPAGEKRTAATGARLKRMGAKPGVSDFIFIAPNGLFYGLELKRKNGRLSEAQETFQDWCRRHCVPYAVANSYDTAKEILVAWGVIETSRGWSS